MALSNLIPSLWRDDPPARAEGRETLTSLWRDMDRFFEAVGREWGLGPRTERTLGTYFPRVDVVEGEDHVEVTAELPGVEEKDLDVSLAGETLTIRGEKRSEKEERGKNYHRVERSAGTFQRTVALPCEVAAEKAEALFTKGVLKIRLPKPEDTKAKSRKISIRSS